MDKLMCQIEISEIMINEMLDGNKWYDWRAFAKATLKELKIIKELLNEERASAKTSNEKSALPIPDVSKSLPLPEKETEILNKTYKRLISKKPTKL